MSGKPILRRRGIVAQHKRLPDKRLLAIAIGSSIALASPSLCKAQCVEFSERVPRIDLQTFSTEPGSLLRQLRNDKDKLAGRLAGYLATDPNLLPSVQKLVNDARTTDRTAIGAGLRRAELRCVASKPAVAQKINEFVRKLGDMAVSDGYAAEADETVMPPSPPPKPSNPGAGLMSGEWKTEIANPFESVPVPE